MVKYAGPGLDATFAALSDATRRGILARLAQGEASVSDLAAPYAMSLPGVSKHLRVLARAKLIAQRKEGRVNRCRLAAGPMKDAAEWIEHYRQFWEQQFDALARFLAESQRKGDETCQRQNRAPKRGFKSGGYSRRRVRQSSKPGQD
jgi:DNA-binding transcriptional ArsR family regulator